MNPRIVRYYMHCMVAVSLLLVSLPAYAQSWSDWRYTTGGGTGIEYRWRMGMCLAPGCLKDVEFRNNTKQTIRFDYTIWSEGMADKGVEVKNTGTISVFPESTSKAVAGAGGNLKRVHIVGPVDSSAVSIVDRIALDDGWFQLIYEVNASGIKVSFSRSGTTAEIRFSEVDWGRTRGVEPGGRTSKSFPFHIDFQCKNVRCANANGTEYFYVECMSQAQCEGFLEAARRASGQFR